MLDELLGSGSEFDRACAVLGLELRKLRPGCRPLSRDKLELYRLRRFVIGWTYTRVIAGSVYEFRVLLDCDFPRSHIRIAIAADQYLRWPHVEEQGVLCLPTLIAPQADLRGVLSCTIDDAETLVAHCAAEPSFVESELSREFLSYWHRTIKANSVPVRSLLDPTNRKTRRIAVWRGRQFYLVAETKSEIEHWGQNCGQKVKAIEAGYYGFLNSPPIPPFPPTGSAFLTLLEERCPETVDQFKNSQTSLSQTVVFVLAAQTVSGNGLIAVSLKLTTTDGFQKNTNLGPKQKLILWKLRGQIEGRKVERIDPSWVHGRGINPDLDKLIMAKVAVLGCGSIGSQVAVRLAQLGVGSLILVDSEVLESANVGRHALGMAFIGRSKAEAQANEITGRFPHVKEVLGIQEAWQNLKPDELEKLAGADLIVSCMGDWPAEGVLNEWLHKLGGTPPVIYGWLDENGTAAHALYLCGLKPCLACVLDEDGQLRVPETDWKDGGRLQTEPACGTIYQPYGPIDVLNAEALICNLAVDVITGRAATPQHRIYATSTARVKELGGSWSEAHLKVRPPGFAGPFEFSRPVEPYRDCRLCGDDT